MVAYVHYYRLFTFYEQSEIMNNSLIGTYRAGLQLWWVGRSP